LKGTSDSLARQRCSMSPVPVHSASVEPNAAADVASAVYRIVQPAASGHGDVRGGCVTRKGELVLTQWICAAHADQKALVSKVFGMQI
jgi:hypothetical protein